jgi:hypothetical protein
LGGIWRRRLGSREVARVNEGILHCVQDDGVELTTATAGPSTAPLAMKLRETSLRMT